LFVLGKAKVGAIADKTISTTEEEIARLEQRFHCLMMGEVALPAIRGLPVSVRL
jgi:hypothetical protein